MLYVGASPYADLLAPFRGTAPRPTTIIFFVRMRRAHRNNDRAVLRAYGFPTNDSFTESDCVARLFQLYADWGK